MPLSGPAHSYHPQATIGHISILIVPPPPLNQGQCLSVSKADSIDFRNHTISFSSSHRLATKEKNTHFTHTTREKNRLHSHTTKRKKNHFISHPTLLVVPNNPKSRLLRSLPSLLLLVYMAVLLSLLLSFDGQKIFGFCRK